MSDHLRGSSDTKAPAGVLANVSHEILTPMSAIIGMTELALDTELTGEQREYLQTVRSSALTLLTTLNRLLDFADIVSGDLRLEEVDFTLEEVLGGTIEPLSRAAAQKGVDVSYHQGEGVPERLRGDPGRLRQVIATLVENAVKFTAEGDVRVVIEKERDLDPGVELRFEISDSGIGIPPERLDDIFDSFIEVDGSATRRFGGTGVGLSVASRIVDEMGGEIRVDSKEGRGNTFRFTARFGAEARRPSPQSMLQARPLRVLLAEDTKVNQLLAVRLLERLGHTVVLAEDGREAVELWRGSEFDLVLMDLQMPRMGGLEAAAHIRELERDRGGYTPIVAVTTDTSREARSRCVESGMDEYVSKPIDCERLREVMAKVTGRQGAGRSGTAGR